MSWVFHGGGGPIAEAALALHRLVRGKLLALPSREAIDARTPSIAGPIVGKPWRTTGYGLVDRR